MFVFYCFQSSHSAKSMIWIPLGSHTSVRACEQRRIWGTHPWFAKVELPQIIFFTIWKVKSAAKVQLFSLVAYICRRIAEKIIHIHKIYSVSSKKMCTYTKISTAKVLLFSEMCKVLGRKSLRLGHFLSLGHLSVLRSSMFALRTRAAHLLLDCPLDTLRCTLTASQSSLGTRVRQTQTDLDRKGRRFS